MYLRFFVFLCGLEQVNERSEMSQFLHPIEWFIICIAIDKSWTKSHMVSSNHQEHFFIYSKSYSYWGHVSSGVLVCLLLNVEVSMKMDFHEQYPWRYPLLLIYDQLNFPSALHLASLILATWMASVTWRMGAHNWEDWFL